MQQKTLIDIIIHPKNKFLLFAFTMNNFVMYNKQPVTYLKEILKEVCVYNMKNPHKNMWELKPEYRHYKQEEETKSEDKKKDDDSSDDDE